MLGYEILGSGDQKVIILHDWLGCHDNYDPMLNYMDTDTFQYAFVDLRGYGLSKHINGPFTAEQSAHDVIEVADDLGWTEFHLVGHSMTGQVGLKMISKIEDRIQSFVAVAPVPVTSANMPAEMIAGIKGALETREGRVQMLSTMWGDRLSEEWLNFKVDRWLSQCTTEAAQGYLDMFGSEDFSDELSNPQTPMLVVACEQDMDGFQPADILQGYGSYENASFATIYDSSHYPMQETPVLLASLLDGFWKQHVK